MKIHSKAGKESLPKWAKTYLREWAKRLTLHEWRITAYLHPGEPGEPMGYASINRNIQRADITIRQDVPQKPDTADLEEWKLTIIHELLHVRFANITYCVVTDILGQFGEQSYQLAYADFDTRLEQLIERMANILYELENGRK